MSYLTFDKSQLINLNYSLGKEILYTNGLGAYSLTTIVGCNTRKYHGLLVSPMTHLDGDNHVLLSALDETVIQKDSEFNQGIRKYEGDNYVPRGHKYVRDFLVNSSVKTVYRVGSVILTKEVLMVEKEEQLLIRYTIDDAHDPLLLRFRPFLAFRNVHDLSKANLHAQTKVKFIKNGIQSKLYDGYPSLKMQFSITNEFVPVPDWYYNVEYMEEMKRGYEYKEDLFVPGFFEMHAKKGDVIIFSASTKEVNPAALKRKFTTKVNASLPQDNFLSCLKQSTRQFIIEKDKQFHIIAGYPWFGSWGRDTFIALPGLTFSQGQLKTGKAILDSMIAHLQDGLFPNNIGPDNKPVYNSIDAPLWFFWTLQQYVETTGDPVGCWKEYETVIKEILTRFRDGTRFNIKMHDNGLIFGGQEGVALTWMDAVIEGIPVTPRIGYNVEINALWYNAVMFAIDLAKKSEDHKFLQTWKELPEKISHAFIDTFWDKQKGYLADTLDASGNKDWSVRCNMIFACSLPYSPLSDDQKHEIINVVHNELLTPRGLRTLSPKNPDYRGVYEGTQAQRDEAYHQGSVWPWLLEYYARSYLSLYKKSGVQHIEDIVYAFEEDLHAYGVGTIAELYDGDPPHKPKGAVSQAWSVAALLQIIKIVEQYK
ncbi:MAG: amylo-alpha-1,6-glucosidase [Bacteroidetes bacterium]|jgi:predicted glycogen debranching enzyme|nr:amylo-alpha-1,6-glucosidase [Bacteroidota bacterium]